MLVNLSTNGSSGSLLAQTLIFNAARLRRVKCWAIGGSEASDATIDWSTTNPFYGSNGKARTYCQLGLTTPLALDEKPPRESFANAWVDSSATNYVLFTLNVNGVEGCYLDLEVDFVMLDYYTANPISFNLRSTQTWSSSPLGQLLYTYADNQAGTPAWKPIGVPNIY